MPTPGSRPAARHRAPFPRNAIIAAAALGLVLAGGEARAQDGARKASDDAWTVIWPIYLWASGIEGRVGAGGNVIEIDVGFRDLVKKLDGALFLPLELRKGRWAAVLEVIAIRLGDQRAFAGRLFDRVDLESDQTLIELSPRYRLTRPGALTLEALAGLRLWHLSTTLTLHPANPVLPELTLGVGELWADPIVGARALARPGGRWQLSARGDLGGFGIGSEFTWQLIGLVGYEVASGTTLLAGYRQLDVDFRDDDDGFVYDTGTGGWVIGVAIRL